MALQKPAPVRLTTNELRTRLAAFAHKWKGASSEDADEKLFTADFLACFDIAAHQYKREYAVPKQDGSTGYMDGFIPGKLIIEGKSLGKDLKKARAQAEAYRWGCAPHEQPRYVLLHDFERFALFDLSQDTQHPTTLAKLPAHADWFRFLVDAERPVIVEETEADRKAAEQMARLHDALLRSNFAGRDLEVFLTRLLFCLFADDTAIFGDNGQFKRLVQATRADGKDLGPQLAELFEVLNTEPAQRSRLLDEDLAAFAYINGQLFADRTRIPAFDSSLRTLLLDCVNLDWSGISPAIFGAMFQSVLEQHQPDLSRQASRRELGAHYTSERNILRAINPLFMDGLRAELAAAGSSRAKLLALYDRLPTLKIFDPACGCGNFLVIAYRELRLLENELIDKLFSKGGQSKGLLDIGTQSRVTVDQFYGLEIDPSAAHIAQVALWITDHQLNLITADRFGSTRPSIPLVKSAHIRQGNALRVDWAEVLAPEQCSFIVAIRRLWVPSTKVPNSAKTWLRCWVALPTMACSTTWPAGMFWPRATCRPIRKWPAPWCPPTAFARASRSACCGRTCWGWECASSLRTAPFSGATKARAWQRCTASSSALGRSRPRRPCCTTTAPTSRPQKASGWPLPASTPTWSMGLMWCWPGAASRCARCRKWALATNPLTAATTCLPRKKKPIFCCKSRALRRIFGAGWERRSFSTASNAGVCGWAMPLLPLWPLCPSAVNALPPCAKCGLTAKARRPRSWRKPPPAFMWNSCPRRTTWWCPRSRLKGDGLFPLGSYSRQC